MSLREGCKRILVADSFNLLDRLVKTQKRAVSVDSKYNSGVVWCGGGGGWGGKRMEINTLDYVILQFHQYSLNSNFCGFHS